MSARHWLCRDRRVFDKAQGALEKHHVGACRRDWSADLITSTERHGDIRYVRAVREAGGYKHIGTRPRSAPLVGGTILGAISADARAESASDRCVELLREYQRRTAVLEGRGRDLSRKDTAWLAEPLNELVATPARTARDFAAKIVAHANLLGIGGDGDAMSVVEASAIRDARTLLGAPVA